MNFGLYNCDCLELLNRIDDGHVDLVLIDPPYEISRVTGFQNTRLKKYEKVSMEFGEWDKDFNKMREVICESYRVLKDGGSLICFYDLWKISYLYEYFTSANFKQLRFIEWVKTNPVPLNSKLNYLTNAREIAVTGVKKSKPVFNSEYDNGIYRYPIYHGEDRFHPTQKPVELFEELILKHTNTSDIVCDCFCGSGTTAIACRNTNRNFIGCELNKDYYEKSMRRLKNHTRQMKLNIGD